MSLEAPDAAIDPANHPAYNKKDATQHYAGDVISFPSERSNPTPNLTGVLNKTSMDDIAKHGKSRVDTTNLTVFKPKQ